MDREKSLGQTVRMVGEDEKERYRIDFIQRVRQGRASTGQKQWQIALAMGLEQDEYKHFESTGSRGRVIPHHLMARFCYACQVDPVWLLTGHGKMKGTPAPQPMEPAEQAPVPRKAKKSRAKRVA